MSDLDYCTFYLDMMIFKNRNLRKLIFNQNVYVKQILRNHKMWHQVWWRVVSSKLTSRQFNKSLSLCLMSRSHQKHSSFENRVRQSKHRRWDDQTWSWKRIHKNISAREKIRVVFLDHISRFERRRKTRY